MGFLKDIFGIQSPSNVGRNLETEYAKWFQNGMDAAIKEEYDISIVFKPGSFTYDKLDYTLRHNIRIQVIAGIPYLAFTDQFDVNDYISIDCIAAWSVEKSVSED